MKSFLNRKLALILVGLVVFSGLATPQLKQLIKLVGVGAAVTQFGPQINTAINKLDGHRDSRTMATKVVPIISAGINSRQAVGAAQVMGPKALVDKVTAVMQLDQDLFGREVKVRAMIPVESKDVISNIKRVEGVGVSGIVDLKL